MIGKTREMCEILAPAGSIECAVAAVNAGADAIYLGMKSFSARDAAENFDFSELVETCGYAHAFSVKVYVALNTLVKEKEIPAFLDGVKSAVTSGADALILQDMYLGSLIKAANPGVELHLSTQAGACNEYGAKAARDFGFSRVILARETPIAEIERMTKILDCEAFVQGALCTCFSGQCYFSSFVGGNSGNRGRCKQPCRRLYSWDRPGFDDFAYRLSLSDLSVGSNIKKLVDVGVNSFKIEGRLRRPEYVAAAVAYYKALCGGSSSDESEDALGRLKRAYNRGDYTNGLAFGQDGTLVSSDVQGHIGEYVGDVKIVKGKPVCVCDELFEKGDSFKILRGDKELCGAAFGTPFCDGSMRGFVLSCSETLRNGDKVRVTGDASLKDELLKNKRLIPLDVRAFLHPDEAPRVAMNDFEYFGETILPRAKSSPVSEKNISECFSKRGDYPYDVVVSVDCGDVFMPISALNEFRRSAYAAYWEHITKKIVPYVDPVFPGSSKVCRGDAVECVSLRERECEGDRARFACHVRKIAVIAEDLSALNADIGILKLKSFRDVDQSLWENFDGERYVFLPAFMTSDEISDVARVISLFDGVYADGAYGMELAKKLGVPLFAGTGFNITNSVDVNLVDARYIALSKELTTREAALSAKLVCTDKTADATSAKRPSSNLSRSDNLFYLTAGGIKLMDLIYCPFGRKCSTCDRRTWYALTDETGRRFPVRRYETSQCRFELYNCDVLVGDNDFAGILVDCTGMSRDLASATLADLGDAEKLKSLHKNHTSGHAKRPIL